MRMVKFLLPEIKGKMVPLPLPGGYWTGALLLLNLALGGVIRVRKGWKNAGNLISHLGIIFMLVGAGMAHHFSERGNMAVAEGQSSNAAEDYFEYVIEVTEIVDGEAATIHVIRGKWIDDLREGRNRVFRFPDLPFDLDIGGYLTNASPVALSERAPELGEHKVLPNHAHVLVRPLPGFELDAILHSWKSYSAQEINKLCHHTGTLWQSECYDRIVRDSTELMRTERYIREN